MQEKTTIRTFGLVSLKQNVILNICTLTEIKIPTVLKTSVQVFIFHRLSRPWKWWILFSELSKSVRTGVGQFHHTTSQFTSGEMETPDNLPPVEYVLLCDNFSNESLSLSLSYKHADWWISSQSILTVTGWQLLVMNCSGLLFFCRWIVQWWTVWRWLIHAPLGPSQLRSLSRKFKVLPVQCAVLHCFFLLPSCLVLICVRLPWLETQGLKHVARNVNVSELKK